MNRMSRCFSALMVGGVIAGLVGPAGKSVAGVKPPDHCSRAKARPANANGSVLVRPVTAPAPEASPRAIKPGGVMIFDKPEDPAKPISGALVPALQAPHKTLIAVSRAVLSEANQPHFGSC